MRYVAMLTIVDEQRNQQYRPAHLQYLNELYQAGQVVVAGPFADGRGGMVIYECADAEQAQRLAEADPVVLHGARTVTVRAWKPLALPID